MRSREEILNAIRAVMRAQTRAKKMADTLAASQAMACLMALHWVLGDVDTEDSRFFNQVFESFLSDDTIPPQKFRVPRC